MTQQLRLRTARSLICFLSAAFAMACSGSDDAGAPSDVRAAGGRGSTTSEVAIPDIPKEKIGELVFDESQVQSYYLSFSDAEYARLMDLSTLMLDPYTVNEERYVEASLRFGDTELPSIGVRFKGNYSIRGCVDLATKQRAKRVEPFFGSIDVCQRFSLKLDFNRYVDELRLDGLKKLNLHSMSADPSKMRERLGYSLFREMDIVAPRIVHARVYINGEYHGLFAAVEDVDGRFTANRFPESGDGNLYRDIWPTASVTQAEVMESLRTNDEPSVANVSDFLAFRDAIVAATDADFATKLAPYIDFDHLARYIVVDRGINNFDGIMSFYFGLGWGPFNQNYYWYDTGANRFTLIPWDLDKALWYPEPNFWSDNAPNGLNIVPNWNVVTNGCNGYTCYFDEKVVVNGAIQEGNYDVREIDCEPFLRRLRGTIYDRQKAIAEAFIAGPFSQQSVQSKLEAWRTQIAPALSEDALVDSGNWQSAVDQLEAGLPKLHGNLRLMMSGLISE